MACLRCGREMATEGAFCQECQADMSRYPVPPGTPVILPKRRTASQPRRGGKRRSPSLEDQIKVLRRRVRVLAALVLLLLITSVVLAFPAWKQLTGSHLRPGQNYSSVVPTTTAPAN